MDGTVNFQHRFYIPLPDVQAHSHHSCGGAARFAQIVHPSVIQEIRSIVSSGITKVQDVRAAVKRFVKTRLVIAGGIKPQETNRAYYPTSVDIKNHIYLAKQSLKLSSVDQENLFLKIKQWQSESPDSGYHFRPYRRADVESGISSHSAESLPSLAANTEQNLLYVHQESWQQDLLARYGNIISLIDATYKTTKYDLALFFICVKTNVNYMVVADYIVQYERVEQIAEALSVLQSWNPEWQPRFWMSDYSESQITALSTAFPNSTVYLCDFHREQAWTRWTRDSKHGLSAQDREDLLSILRRVAFTPPCHEEGKTVDTYYRNEERKLRESNVWKQHQQVRQWLSRKWLTIPEVNSINHTTSSHIHTHTHTH